MQWQNELDVRYKLWFFLLKLHITYQAHSKIYAGDLAVQFISFVKNKKKKIKINLTVTLWGKFPKNTAAVKSNISLKDVFVLLQTAFLFANNLSIIDDLHHSCASDNFLRSKFPQLNKSK